MHAMHSVRLFVCLNHGGFDLAGMAAIAAFSTSSSTLWMAAVLKGLQTCRRAMYRSGVLTGRPQKNSAHMAISSNVVLYLCITACETAETCGAHR